MRGLHPTYLEVRKPLAVVMNNESMLVSFGIVMTLGKGPGARGTSHNGYLTLIAVSNNRGESSLLRCYVVALLRSESYPEFYETAAAP